MAGTDITRNATKQATVGGQPHSLFDAMRADMERLFERFESGWPRWPMAPFRATDRAVIVPELDVRDEGRQLVIETELPGVDEKDVTVKLTNGVLTIKGEKKSEHEEKQANYYMSERSFGSFERSVRLPDTIDDSKIEARFDKGVLKVVAAKKAEAVKAEKKIEIKKA